MRGTVDRWRFLAIAAEGFADRSRIEVENLLSETQAWFCSPDLGSRRFLPQWSELAEGPTEAEVRARLSHLERDPDWSEEAAVVVVVAGRGFTSGGVQYVLLRDSDVNSVDTTALRLFDLLTWLGQSSVRHLAVFLDLDLPVEPSEFAPLLDREASREWLIVAADRASSGGVGLLDALSSFVKTLHSAEGRRYGEGPYLPVMDLVDDLQTELGAGRSLRFARSTALDGPFACLPNPHAAREESATSSPSLGSLTLPLADLETHWGPRSRGVAVHDDGGWLFAGRAHLMRAILTAATGRPRTTVVTGGAGSGKSAVLARLVTLSDPKFVHDHDADVRKIPSDLRPPVGAVDAAVVGTGKLPSQILAEICGYLRVATPGLDRRTPTTEELLESWAAWLAARTEPVTVVIDGLDEATDPEGLIKDVLQILDPDPDAPKLRLILGVRSLAAGDDTSTSVARTDGVALVDLAVAGLRASKIAVDELPWWDPTDVTAYVESILWNTPSSPYPGAGPDATKAVAHAVADKSGRSFLIARIAAASLASREEVISDTDREWLDALDNGVLGVFREDLRHTLSDPADRRRAVMLLRAVAYARGVGLPWRGVWPIVASAVDDSGRHYGDTDIAWLLGSRLGAYLITDRDGDSTVYRLFHDLLRTTLRDRWREVLQNQ